MMHPDARLICGSEVGDAWSISTDVALGLTESYMRAKLGARVDEGFLSDQLDYAWQIISVMAEKPDAWIILMGPKGVGKSLVAWAISRWVHSPRNERHTFVPWYEMSGRVSLLGYDAVRRMINNPVLTIDDLGMEPRWANHMGNRIDFVQIILSGRYDYAHDRVLFYKLQEGIPRRTIITTHLTREALQEKYGDHLWIQRVEEVSVPILIQSSHSIRAQNKSELWEKL